MDVKKVMISLPMTGRTDAEITADREAATAKLASSGYEVVNSYFNDEWKKHQVQQETGIVNVPVAFLAKAIDVMAHCHAVYFCKGWENARGCVIEHKIAKDYGLDLIYEEEPKANASFSSVADTGKKDATDDAE